MNPGIGALSPCDDLIGRIEGTGVHISCLDADDGWTLDWRQAIGPDGSLAVRRQAPYSAAPHTQHRENLVERSMRLLADEEGKRRSTEQSLLVNIPTVLSQNPIPRRCQATEIRHRRTSDQRAFRGSR